MGKNTFLYVSCIHYGFKTSTHLLAVDVRLRPFSFSTSLLLSRSNSAVLLLCDSAGQISCETTFVCLLDKFCYSVGQILLRGTNSAFLFGQILLFCWKHSAVLPFCDSTAIVLFSASLLICWTCSVLVCHPDQIFHKVCHSEQI